MGEDVKMSKKHHSARSEPTGVAASPARRPSRTKGSASPIAQMPSPRSRDPRPLVHAEPVIDREAVARLAYSYWEARGRTGGSADEDWLRAELEIRAQFAASAVA